MLHLASKHYIDQFWTKFSPVFCQISECAARRDDNIIIMWAVNHSGIKAANRAPEKF